MSVRTPAVAGRFFPDTREMLEPTVAGHLAAARPSSRRAVPRAIIGPHAGYAFSGPIAGTAFAMLQPLGPRLRRVIVIGPSHHVVFDGVATSGATHFRTPLGDMVVDRHGVEVAERHAVVEQREAAHAPEHSIETHLPFLQMINPDARIVPLVTGQCDERPLAHLLDELWDDETVLCVSSDLSHFEDYVSATRHDAETTARIVGLDASIGPRDACGAVSIRGLLAVARDRGLACEAIDVRNSGDTAGGRDRVVGYGAYGFWDRV